MYWQGHRLFITAPRRGIAPAKKNSRGLARQGRLRAGLLLYPSGFFQTPLCRFAAIADAGAALAPGPPSTGAYHANAAE